MGCVSPQVFNAPLAVRLYVSLKKLQRCKNGTDLICHHADYGGARTSRSTGWQKKLDFLRFLSVVLLNAKVCKWRIAIKPFKLIKVLIPLDG